MHATRRIRNTGGWKAARMLRAAALLLALCLSGGVALRTGATGETYNWYCAHVRGHMQPRADGRFAFIRDCGGFYIDDRPEHTAADGADKVVYLTFDAGYENGNVARVLDALAQADAAGRSLCWAIWRGRIPTLSAGWRRRDIWCAIIRMRTGI